MSGEGIEPERSRERHLAAALNVAIRCVRSFMFLLGPDAEGMSDEQCQLQLDEAIAEARDLLHSIDGTQPAGELPPIPAQEVPPIPAGPVVGLEFWRRGGNN